MRCFKIQTSKCLLKLFSFNYSYIRLLRLNSGGCEVLTLRHFEILKTTVVTSILLHIGELNSVYIYIYISHVFGYQLSCGVTNKYLSLTIILEIKMSPYFTLFHHYPISPITHNLQFP